MRILIPLLILLFATPAFADASIFRNFVWGASKEDVRKFESAKFYKEEGDSLFFLEKPDAFRRLIRYDFRGGKLWGARYEYQELDYPNSSSALNQYADEEMRLEKLYGPPVEESFIWKNKTYRNFPQFWPRALSSGDLRIETTWQVNDTKIVLQCFHDGEYYQLFYTLELTGKAGAAQNDAGRILNLPALQGKSGP